MLVRWNEPYQKLATCDADGGIFVWIQYEGRWSVELVNDRGAQVSGLEALSVKDCWRDNTGPVSQGKWKLFPEMGEVEINKTRTLLFMFVCIYFNCAALVRKL